MTQPTLEEGHQEKMRAISKVTFMKNFLSLKNLKLTGKMLLHFVEKVGIFFLTLILLVWQKLLSPLFGQRCRFFPSCSAYAIEALSKHGLLKGGFYSAKRVCSCHPFNPGGVDFVPKAKSQTF